MRGDLKKEENTSTRNQQKIKKKLAEHVSIFSIKISIKRLFIENVKLFHYQIWFLILNNLHVKLRHNIPITQNHKINFGKIQQKKILNLKFLTIIKKELSIFIKNIKWLKNASK